MTKKKNNNPFYILKLLDTKLNEPTNKNLIIKVPKVLSRRIRKCGYIKLSMYVCM